MDSLSTYTTLVQTEIDDASTGALPLVQQYIREIYQEILRKVGKSLIASTTTDTVVTPLTATYTPTTEPMEIVSVFYHNADNTDFSKLSEITEDEYLDNWINADAGTPTLYYKKGLSVSLVPAPVDAGTLRMVTIDVQPELTTTSIIPERYQQVVKNGATYKYKAWDDNPAATEFEGYYRRQLRDMEMELDTKSGILKPSFFGK